MTKFGFAVGLLTLAVLSVHDIHGRAFALTHEPPLVEADAARGEEAALEPATVFLMGSALFGLGMWARRRLAQRGHGDGGLTLGELPRPGQAEKPELLA
jgi:hypothetical protein